MDKETPQDKNTHLAQPEKPCRLRILIVDDEVAIQESLKEILTRQGNAVDIAGTGADALSMVNRTLYDVIICDIKLPDMNATDRYLQKDMEDILKKTIFISGDMKSEKVAKFLETTHAHYLIKPFHPRDLYKKISEVVRSLPRGSPNSAAA